MFVTAALGRPAQGARAPLQRHRPAFGRSRVDDPDAHRRLLLRHPLGAQAVPGGRAAPGLSLVLQARPRRRGPAPLDVLGEPAGPLPRERCPAPHLRARRVGGDGHWASSRARASPSTPACSRPTPAAITARRRTSSTGPTSSASAAPSPSILRRSTRRAEPNPDRKAPKVISPSDPCFGLDGQGQQARAVRLWAQLSDRHRERGHRRCRGDAGTHLRRGRGDADDDRAHRSAASISSRSGLPPTPPTARARSSAGW